MCLKPPQNVSALVSTNGMHCILLSRMQRRWCTLPGSCYLSNCFKEVEHLIKDTLNFSCHVCFVSAHLFSATIFFMSSKCYVQVQNIRKSGQVRARKALRTF